MKLIDEPISDDEEEDDVEEQKRQLTELMRYLKIDDGTDELED